MLLFIEVNFFYCEVFQTDNRESYTQHHYACFMKL